MGYPPLQNESIPEVQQAVERILHAAHAAGKYAGMFCMSPDQIRRRFEQGCTSYPHLNSSMTNMIDKLQSTS